MGEYVLSNKSIESMEEVGAAIKEVIQYKTIRGKFSSVHPDLAAEGVTRVEVGEEGLHFISERERGEKEKGETVACEQKEEEEERTMVTLGVTERGTDENEE